MMYIKIKEPYEQTIHIMKVNHETEDCYVCELKKDNSYLSVSKEWVLAKSENLAELCDEGVIEVKFSSTGYIAHFNKNIDELRKFLKYLEECQPITKDEILNVYGAIWTSKGLIYVAKMNDKGVLCLI